MSASAITATDLRTFAGQFATGVAVVTTRSPEGELAGVTINAVTSLSLTPPLFLADHGVVSSSVCMRRPGQGAPGEPTVCVCPVPYMGSLRNRQRR